MHLPVNKVSTHGTIRYVVVVINTRGEVSALAGKVDLRPHKADFGGRMTPASRARGPRAAPEILRSLDSNINNLITLI